MFPSTYAPETLTESREAHLVPCRVRLTGPTEEFEDQIIMDNENTNLAHQNMNVTYVRGRKIIGQPVEFRNSDYFLVQSSEDNEGNATMKPISKLSQIVNYEREGNEDRLLEEIKRFNELRNLEALIHEN